MSQPSGSARADRRPRYQVQLFSARGITAAPYATKATATVASAPLANDSYVMSSASPVRRHRVVLRQFAQPYLAYVLRDLTSPVPGRDGWVMLAGRRLRSKAGATGRSLTKRLPGAEHGEPTWRRRSRRRWRAPAAPACAGRSGRRAARRARSRSSCPASLPATTATSAVVTGRERDRRHLRLVAHLGEEERDQRRRG